MDILLFSNGRMSADSRLLAHGVDPLRSMLTRHGVQKVLFVPYAIIRTAYGAHVSSVQETLEPMGIQVVNITDFPDPVSAVHDADAIFVSGGNTWYLNRCLHDYGLISALRRRVLMDGKPYVGWSAGANVACPTILTTNDMPIISAVATHALNLVPFQLNPHYVDSSMDGHMGETRDERIAEFLLKNPHQVVVGLREGSWLSVRDGVLGYGSNAGQALRLFRHDCLPMDFDSTSDLRFLQQVSC